MCSFDHEKVTVMMQTWTDGDSPILYYNTNSVSGVMLN